MLKSYLSSSLTKRWTKFLTRTMSSESNSDVLFEIKGKTGIITLNRPKALNALNLSMVKKLTPQLREWEMSSSIDKVLIKGAGDKSFCAGGDVKHLSQEGLKGNHIGVEFFRNEYTLNYLIGTYEKPYIALLDGITMGGGVGLSVHGKYRIATERTLFAMPETAIGLFPDVGGTHFLPQLPNRIGFYLALTGERLKGSDVYLAGIATHYIPSEKLNEFEKALNESTNSENVLNAFHIKPTKPFSLDKNINNISNCFAPNTVLEIMDNLKKDGSDWAKKTLDTLNKMSPLSVVLSHEALVQGSQKNLHECLQMEFRLACRACEKGEFYEGVRALLIDKDLSPKWKFKSISQVPKHFVQSHFEALSSPANELSLPTPKSQSRL